MSDTTQDQLTILLPPSSPYVLAYSIPLLVISCVLTFAGTFLMVDRTREFIPHYDTLPGGFGTGKGKGGRRWYRLEGGVGGLAAGFAFGVHLATFLSLIMPSGSSITATSFIPIYVLPSVFTTLLGGRFKPGAYLFASLTGGVLFSLSLSITIHPALLTRIILTAIFTPLFIVLSLLPIPKTQRPFLRLSTCSAGAGGLCIAIGLLANVTSWANAWERYRISDGDDWGTQAEKGLTAGFWLFLVLGIGCDWGLRKVWGECPDEKWDSYLANYTTNLPNRQGKFEPFVPFWKRLFTKPSTTADIIFPPSSSSHNIDKEFQVKLPPYSSPTIGKLHKHDPFSHHTDDEDADDEVFKPSPGFLVKKAKKGHHRHHHHRHHHRKRREDIKFRPLDDAELSSASSSSSSSSDSEDDEVAVRPPRRPWLKHNPSMSSTTPTLVEDDNPTASPKLVGVDYDKDIKKLVSKEMTGGERKVSKGLGEGEVPEYSDFEDSPTATTSDRQRKEEGKEWSPGFIKAQAQKRTDSPPATSASALSPLAAVPATPSLIKALDRIELAKRDAFKLGSASTSASSQDSHSHSPTRTRADSSPRAASRTRKESSPRSPAKKDPDVKAVAMQNVEEEKKNMNNKWDEFWRGVKGASVSDDHPTTTITKVTQDTKT